MSNIFDLFKKIEKKADTTPVSFIIAGLGNPGAQYEKTRHNVGFVAIDYIAEKLGVRIDRAKFHALTAETKIGEVRVLLMKPQTFMNNSGVAIGEAASFYKIPPERVLILHDEISFEPGIMSRVGGHYSDDCTNTLRSHMGDNQMCVAVENHPNDSRVNIDESGTVQTLTGRAGTGGGNVPMVMAERLPGLPLSENMGQCLLGSDYKGVQCVFEEPKTLKVRCGCDVKCPGKRKENLRKDTDNQKRQRKQKPEDTVSNHHFGTADAGNNKREHQYSTDCDQYTYAI